jgi:hypothetical protein
VPTGTYNLDQATRACQEYVAAVSPGADNCITVGCGCPPDECTYNEAAGAGQVRRVWFYRGQYIGNTTDNQCAFGLAWDSPRRSTTLAARCVAPVRRRQHAVPSRWHANRRLVPVRSVVVVRLLR